MSEQQIHKHTHVAQRNDAENCKNERTALYDGSEGVAADSAAAATAGGGGGPRGGGGGGIEERAAEVDDEGATESMYH